MNIRKLFHIDRIRTGSVTASGILLYLLFMFPCHFSWAQTPFLVKDINNSPLGSNLSRFTKAGSALYFTANDGTNGAELWKAEGDSAFLVKDINVGTSGSFPRNFAAFGDAVYFSAIDDVHSQELWKASGDTAFLLRDINSNGGSSPEDFTVVGNDIYFAATDEAHGRELWKIHNDSVYLVEDITPGSFRSNPKDFVVADSVLYFIAEFGSNSGELYKAIGDSAFRVKGLSYKRFATPQQLTAFGSSLYFSAVSPENGREVWKAVGDTAYMLKDIYNGTNGSDPLYFSVVDSVVYFSADDGMLGRELWKIENDSVSLVFDINAGSTSASPINLTVADDVLYFIVTEGSTKRLWAIDKAALFTPKVPVGFNAATISQITVKGNSIYFNAEGNQLGSELWVAREDTVVLIKDIDPGPNSSLPLDLEVVGDVLYFVADDGQTGDELWVVLGDNAFLAGDIQPGSVSSRPGNLIAVGNTVYLEADDGVHGTELWKVKAPLFSEINFSACGSYEFGGETYSQRGMYLDTISTAANRDSIVILHLTVTQVNKDANWDGTTFTAEADNVTYQWIDCADGNAPVLDATNKTYTPERSGTYAVIVSENGCMDTSKCEKVLVTNSIETRDLLGFEVYPNPAREKVLFENKNVANRVSIELLNLNGQVVLTETTKDATCQIDVGHLVRGVYILKLSYLEEVGFYRVVLQ